MTDGGSSRAAELVERALAAANLPTIAYVTERAEANLRWAGNALTTNGEMTSTELTVVATAEVDGGTSIGTVSRQVTDVGPGPRVRGGGRGGGTVRSALARRGPAGGAAGAPRRTSVSTRRAPRSRCRASVALGLGRAFTDAAGRDQRLYGFAEHIVTTTYLGSTTGLRLRGVQPTGRLELNGKSSRRLPDPPGSARPAVTSATSTWPPCTPSWPPGWAGPSADRPAARPLRDDPAARAGGRPDDLRVLDRQRPRRRGGPERVRHSRRGHQDRQPAVRAAAAAVLRPEPARDWSACRSSTSASAGDGTSFAVDAGLPIAPDGLDARRRLERAGPQPRLGRARPDRPATPPADNLILDGGGDATLEEMIARTERGLLLTCLWYIREVDPERLLLTGLTRTAST